MEHVTVRGIGEQNRSCNFGQASMRSDKPVGETIVQGAREEGENAAGQRHSEFLLDQQKTDLACTQEN